MSTFMIALHSNNSIILNSKGRKINIIKNVGPTEIEETITSEYGIRSVLNNNVDSTYEGLIGKNSGVITNLTYDLGDQKMFNFIYKTISIFKFIKPKTIYFGACPQSIKAKEVELKPTNDGLFVDKDGLLYAAQKINSKKKLTFSDGQTFNSGEIAYFKIEPIEWEVGRHVYLLKNKRNKKSNQFMHISKYVLGINDTINYFKFNEEETNKLQNLKIIKISLYANYLNTYVINPNGQSNLNAKRHAKRNLQISLLLVGLQLKVNIVFTHIKIIICVFIIMVS